MLKIITCSDIISNMLDTTGINFFTPCILNNICIISQACFIPGFKGKTTDFSRSSNKHRTTIGHFLNKGVWNDKSLDLYIRQTVINKIYSHAKTTGKPVFCIVDDTIASKTKPSSQALHPIEAAYFHQSHLKGCMDYGHQAVGIMLSCGSLILNYAIVMYDKTKSKIDIVKEIARELPEPPVNGYLLCDSWYTATSVIDEFSKKGFHTIGALKINRLIYPQGVKIPVREFAEMINHSDKNVELITIRNRSFYVYRYDGKMKDLDGVTVLISYPAEAFGNPQALRVFLSTDSNISTQEILNMYAQRWPIEVFFRDSKGKLALDKYQIRTAKGINRYWLIMSLTHLMCCIATGKAMPFSKGYAVLKLKLQQERITTIYNYAKNGVPIEFLGTIAC